MGAKSSTPSGQQSPRSRTFSSSSTGVADTSTTVFGAGVPGHNGTDSGQGFNLLRNFAGLQVTQTNSTSDRQRARSLSSMQDMHQQQQQAAAAAAGNMPLGGQAYGQANNHFVGNSPGQQHQQQQRHIRDSIRAMVLNGGGGGAVAPTNRGHSHPLNIDDLSDISSSLVSSEYGITFATTGASSSNAAATGLSGGVYTATSLPAHIWSFNGIKCPVCSKFILPDDIEYHLVMCLTKPRLSYNEDVLSDAKGECVICLEDLNPGDIIARLPCLCIYHKGCIDRWFEVNRCCPEHPGD